MTKQSFTVTYEVPTLINVRTRIDERLNTFFDTNEKRAASIDARYQLLWTSLHGLTGAGGKRLRPYMTVLAFWALKQPDTSIDESLYDIATSQELLHQAMLIHDDIIDRDFTRYGVANIAGQYQSIYENSVAEPDLRLHYASSAALLAGDAAIAAAHQIISESSASDAHKLIAHELVSQSMFTVIGGELIDTESAFLGQKSVDPIVIARHKTADYSFITPLVLGARLAGVDTGTEQLLRTLGESIGIAFQLRDDLLGSFGDSGTTGKSTEGDIREGKWTFIIQQAYRLMSDEQRVLFDQFFGNQHATEANIKLLKTVLIESGAKQATEKAIKQYTDQAQSTLRLLGLSPQAADIFSELIQLATMRRR